jgi:hypothetical protein
MKKLTPVGKRASSLKHLVLVLASLFIATAATAHAKSIFDAAHPQVCGHVLKESDPSHDFGLPNPAYNFMTAVDESKSYRLADEPVLDQKQYGCCWLTSELGRVCRLCLGAGKNIRPVDTYSAAISIGERAAREPLLRGLIDQGGNAPYAIDLLNRYGFFPEGALVETAEGLKPWAPIVDFQKGKNGDRLIETINMKLVNYYAKTNDAYLELEKAVNAAPKDKKGMTTFDEGAYFKANPEKLKIFNDSLTEYQAVVTKTLEATLGDIPESFVYEGKTWNAVDFYKANVPPETMDMTLVMPKRVGVKLPSVSQAKKVYPPSSGADYENNLWNNLGGFEKDQDWSTVDAAIETSLRKGLPVRFSVMIKDSLIDMDRGLISINAFAQYPEFIEEVQRMNAAIPDFVDGGHAILITGIYRNKAGETLGYRIQNSWGAISEKTGKSVGDHGYFIMDTPYMQTFSPNFFFDKGIYPASAPAKSAAKKAAKTPRVPKTTSSR